MKGVSYAINVAPYAEGITWPRAVFRGLFFNYQLPATTKRNAIIGVGVGDLPLTPVVATLLRLRHTTADKIPKPPGLLDLPEKTSPLAIIRLP